MTITQQYVHCVEVPIRDCYIEMPIAIEVGRSNGDDGHASEIPVWLKCPIAFIQQNRESSRYVWTSASGTRIDSKVDVTVAVQIDRNDGLWPATNFIRDRRRWKCPVASSEEYRNTVAETLCRGQVHFPISVEIANSHK